MPGHKFLSDFIWRLCHLLMRIDTSHCCDPFLPYSVPLQCTWIFSMDGWSRDNEWIGIVSSNVLVEVAQQQSTDF
jgi:hypothetical protein